MFRSPLTRLLGAGVAFSSATVLGVCARTQSTLPRVYFDIEAGGKPLGRVVMEVGFEHSIRIIRHKFTVTTPRVFW